MPALSVIICTHNPRPDYLCQVLDALKQQTLPKSQWELLLIDNASKEVLADKWNLSWHSRARHIREEELGLTPARMRGIQEAVSEVLVFVDDDNVLNRDYLEQVVGISVGFPQLGAWGGSIAGVFETTPPHFAMSRLGLLAVGEISTDAWGTLKGFNAACPPGAGLAVRKIVASAFRLKVAKDSMRLSLDRKGDQLTSAGDVDLAWSACDMGYGMGRFKNLKMNHLIAARRLNLEYFARLIEGGTCSNVLLFHLHGMPPYEQPKTVWAKLRRLKQYLAASKEDRIFSQAAQRGVERGMCVLKQALLLKDDAGQDAD